MLRENIKYEGVVLPITVFLGLLIPFFVPNVISSLIKPIGIVFSLFYIIRTNQNIFKTKELILFIVFFGMYAGACIRYNESISAGAIGYLIYILYTACLVTVDYTKKCVTWFFHACFWSGGIFALFVAISNPFFEYNIYTRTNFWVLWQEINSNQIVYFVAIGLAAFPFMIQKTKPTFILKLMYVMFLLLMIYVILLTLSRGGFLCLSGILLLLLINLEWKYLRFDMKKCVVTTIVFLMIVIVAYHYIPFDQMDRILSAESYSDSNGRSEMFSEAIASVSNVFVGDGCDAWTGNHKIHNIFISIFLQTGFFGLISFAFVVFYQIVNIRSIYALFFAVPMMVEAMVESGDAYTFWVPLFMISMINKAVNESGLEQGFFS